MGDVIKTRSLEIENFKFMAVIKLFELKSNKLGKWLLKLVARSG